MNRRHLIFVLFFLPAFLMAYAPIKTLFYSSTQSEYYSHIVLIPLVSLYLVFQKRKRIFFKQGSTNGGGAHLLRNDYIAGISLLLLGALLYFVGRGVGAVLNQNDFTSIVALSAVVFINGGFILSYGLPAFKATLFPLIFLIFMIPIPSALMDGFIYFLQVGSTEFTNLLFMVTGVPFLREGFVFHLPGMSIEVAKQCSGIRSSLALLITAVLAGHLFLETGGKKVILALAIVPVIMFKNGIRILILTLMGTYWDSRWLTESSLHRDGGILFFILALVLMAPILYFLRKSEEQRRRVSDR
jgi:exosortase